VTPVGLADMDISGLWRILRACEIGMAMAGGDRTGDGPGSDMQLMAKAQAVRAELLTRKTTGVRMSPAGIRVQKSPGFRRNYEMSDLCRAHGCAEPDAGDGLCDRHEEIWDRGVRFEMGGPLPPDSRFRASKPDDRGAKAYNTGRVNAEVAEAAEEEPEEQELTPEDVPAEPVQAIDENDETHEENPVSRPASNAMCNVPGCDRPSIQRGLCNAHRQQWYKYKDTPKGDAIEKVMIPSRLDKDIKQSVKPALSLSCGDCDRSFKSAHALRIHRIGAHGAPTNSEQASKTPPAAKSARKARKGPGAEPWKPSASGPDNCDYVAPAVAPVVKIAGDAPAVIAVRARDLASVLGLVVIPGWSLDGICLMNPATKQLARWNFDGTIEAGRMDLVFPS